MRSVLFFFFNDTATTEIYTLSLHDALPISLPRDGGARSSRAVGAGAGRHSGRRDRVTGKISALVSTARLERARSEEHTSELQSHLNLVCRLLLEKKKIDTPNPTTFQPPCYA